MASQESNFVKKNIPRLLRRYKLSYYKENDCIEYFITDNGTKEQISYAIIFSLNRHSKQINVSRFCPELYKQIESKYLSAACFYLLIHHFANIYHLSEEYSIFLQTRPATYKKFFSRLKDFDLRIKGLKLCETAEVRGEYLPLDVDTSMIDEKILGTEEIPFRV
ncbi:MAG: hypothetical protein JRJ42_00840 [Deltaproteobacteria bacterium]|nr:hypothetical protein [Deltaproteobacteria bacterium]MBW2019093.1 hypothetical protein [Deltaproteobacteria bacterium]MBW2073516.1 hypothetical protein [Deltaproteobacteria bacterium]